MDFTFGIITAGEADSYIQTTVIQIRKQKIPNYEIIIVGKTDVSGSDILNIPFDETVKKGWITRKKNRIAQTARYETIVFMHDYVTICDGWYEGFLKYGNTFQVCTNPIKSLDGSRFCDYTIFHSFNYFFGPNKGLLPYTYTPKESINRIVYMPGNYYVIKRQIALDIPLNEKLCHFDGEDVYFSFELAINNIMMTCNPYSECRLLKQKEAIITEELTQNDIQSLEENPDDFYLMILHKNIKRQVDYLRTIGVSVI
jgi:hypothetical protein